MTTRAKRSAKRRQIEALIGSDPEWLLRRFARSETAGPEAGDLR